MFEDPFTFTCNVNALAMQLRKTSIIPGLCILKLLSVPLLSSRFDGKFPDCNADCEEDIRRELKSLGGKSAIPRMLPKLAGEISGRTRRSKAIT